LRDEGGFCFWYRHALSDLSQPSGGYIVDKEKVCIVGSGKVFRQRAGLIDAFESLGKHVEARATSVPDTDSKTPLLTASTLSDFFASAKLCIVMLSAIKALSPSAEYLERLALEHSLAGNLTLGIGADDEIVFHEQMTGLQHVPNIVKRISFIFIPKSMYSNIRQSGFSMSFFGLDDPPQKVASAMLEYTRQYV
jgi:hypothetical protein